MQSSNHNRDQKRAASLTRKPKHFMVSASPLNSVKLDLAILLMIGIVVFIMVTQFVHSTVWQFLVLFFYGFIGMGWLIHKTRKILSVYTHEQENEDQETH